MFDKKFAVLLIFVLLCSYCYPTFATDSVFVWSDNVTNEAITTSSIVGNNEGNFLNLTCGGAILIEQSTGTVIYDHNSHEQLRPASVTKIMTLLLIMESIDNREYFSR